MHDRADALATDAHIDRLLAAQPTPITDPSLALSVDLLRRTLVRFHPSFRFEERLAHRLRAEAVGERPATGPAPLIAFPVATTIPAAPAPSADRRARGLLVGGAIASGVSIASIGALLVRRRTHRPHAQAQAR